MILSQAQVHEASTLQQASELMARWGAQARLLAGGTDLLVDLKSNRFQAGHIVSINRIAGLRGVSAGDGEVRIGALTTITELAASAVIRDRLPAILDATRDMGGPQIRNMATVGGNIANAVPSADLPPILMAMRARVSLWSPAGERAVPLEEFFVGPRQTVRRGDEILTQIRVPCPAEKFGTAYERFSLREANALAVAGVAASLALRGDGAVAEARICLGAVAPTPRLVAAAGRLLAGKPLDELGLGRAAQAAMEAAQPISDVRGSAEFRRQLVGILTRRVLLTARGRAGGTR